MDAAAKVFVTQASMRRDKYTGMMKPVADLTEAASFGQLEFLTPPGPFILMTPEATKSIAIKLAQFRPSKDYLLLLGDPVIMLVVGQLIGPRARVLRWDKFSRQYTIIQTDTGAI